MSMAAYLSMHAKGSLQLFLYTNIDNACSASSLARQLYASRQWQVSEQQRRAAKRRAKQNKAERKTFLCMKTSLFRVSSLLLKKVFRLSCLPLSLSLSLSRLLSWRKILVLLCLLSSPAFFGSLR